MLEKITDLMVDGAVDHISVDDENLSDKEFETFKKIKEELPQNKKDLVHEYEETINYINALREEEVYKVGFKQGAKLMIQILNEKSGEKKPDQSL